MNQALDHEKSREGSLLEKLQLYLTPGHQFILAGVLFLAIGLLAARTFFSLNQPGGIADIDELPSRSALFQVDVNRAEYGELISIPGVGPSLANAIVDYRSTGGEISGPLELQQIHGIGPKKASLLSKYLVFSKP